MLLLLLKALTDTRIIFRQIKHTYNVLNIENSNSTFIAITLSKWAYPKLNQFGVISHNIQITWPEMYVLLQKKTKSFTFF